LVENSGKLGSTIEDAEAEISTIDSIFKVLHFFISGNVHNSIVVLSSDILRAISNAPSGYTGKILDLIHMCLLNIAKGRHEIPFSAVYFKTVKKLVIKSLVIFNLFIW
jgi:hypothetical protein